VLSALEQFEDWQTINRVIGPHRNFQDRGGVTGHARIHAFEIRNFTFELMVRANDGRRVESFIRKRISNDVKFKVKHDSFAHVLD